MTNASTSFDDIFFQRNGYENPLSNAYVSCTMDCASYFPGIPQLRDACEKACLSRKIRTGFDKCDFLENVVGDEQSIGNYNIDCDSSSGSGSKLLADRNSDLQTPIKIGLVTGLVLVVLFLLWVFVIN